MSRKWSPCGSSSETSLRHGLLSCDEGYLLMAPYTMTSAKPKWGSMLNSSELATNEPIPTRLVITN